jgi:transcriptional regulator with XRE-family HTH domain
MKRLNQAEIAKELGISKSYLSMILSGQRKCPPEFMEKLQSIPGVHKVVNNQLWDMSYTQEVRGSSPLPPTINFLLKGLLIQRCSCNQVILEAVMFPTEYLFDLI